MIKPDYIPFSQEIFDALEHMRANAINPEYIKSEECVRILRLYYKEALSNEYGRYVDSEEGSRYESEFEAWCHSSKLDEGLKDLRKEET